MRGTVLYIMFGLLICLVQVSFAAPSDLTGYYNEEAGWVTLNWTDNPSSPDEDGFLIQRQVNDGVWNDSYASVGTGMTTYNDPIEGDGTYRYRIVGFWGGEEGGITGTTLPTNILEIIINHSPPEAPTDLQYSIVNGLDIHLNWTDNSDTEGYYVVERAIDAGSFSVLHGFLPVDTIEYSDTLLTAGHTYHYQVMAINSYGSSGYSNSISVYLSQDVPNAPSALDISVSGNRVDLTWADNSDNENGFILERQVDSGVFEVLDALNEDVSTYADETLELEHTYAYRVYAYNDSGDSDYSNTVSAYVGDVIYSTTLESISEIDDSFLNAFNPNQNYGTSPYANGSDFRYIIKFNFPALLDGKRIVKAELHLQGWAHSGSWNPDLYMDVYRVSRSWAETEVTWNNALSNTPWTNGGGDYDKFVGQAQIAYYNEESGQIDSPDAISDPVPYPPVDITDVVKRWIRNEVDNNGLLFVNGTEYINNILASENDVHPYLDIRYMNKCSCDNPADFNYDCVVDLNDLVEIASHWQETDIIDELDIAPAGGDGVIDLADLNVFASEWLSDCSGSGGEGEE